MWGIYWLSEDRLASQEGLCFIEQASKKLRIGDKEFTGLQYAYLQFYISYKVGRSNQHFYRESAVKISGRKTRRGNYSKTERGKFSSEAREVQVGILVKNNASI